MPELQDAVSDLLERLPGATKTVEELERRAHTIRNQRHLMELVIIPLVLAIVAVSVWAATSEGSTRSQRVISGPAQTMQTGGTLAPVPLKMVPGPQGW